MSDLYFLSIYTMIKIVIIITIYPIIYYFLNKKYKNIKYENKIYISSNLIKGLILFYLCASYYHKFSGIFSEKEWDDLLYKKIAISYAVTDFCSLFIVSKMALSTIIHHIVVVLFTTLIVIQDIKFGSILYSIILYGFFSSLAYLVNIYLATRFLCTPFVNKIICNCSYYTYILLCIINWSYQIQFIVRNIYSNFYNILLYTGAVSFLVNDDIKLIRFLKKNK